MMYMNHTERHCAECSILVAALPFIVPATKRVISAVGSVLKSAK